MKKVKINTRNGFTLLEILLALTIVGVIAAFTIGISYSIRNMTKVNSTKSRMEQIAAKAKQYYRGHQDLPGPGGTPANSVPVGASDLNMEQKFRLDAWGQYFYYYVDTTAGIPQSGIEGIIYSYGPDQNFNCNAGDVTPSGDDIVVLINVSEKAVEIALDELKILQSKVNAFDAVYEGIDNDGDGLVDCDDTGGTIGICDTGEETLCDRQELQATCPPTDVDNDPNCGTATLDHIEDGYYTGCDPNFGDDALDFICDFYSLSDSYRTDPWDNPYVWGVDDDPLTSYIIGPTYQYPSGDARYHKFFSMGPNGGAGDSDDIIP